MKIIVFDGRMFNFGDLSWEGLSNFGEYEIYDFMFKEQVVEWGWLVDIFFVNKVVLGKNELV